MSYEAIDQAVRVLNEALEADPGAMLALMNFGVTVNQTLADHPTIQVWSKPESTEGRPWGQSLKKPSGAPLNLG